MPHPHPDAPSPWICRFAGLITAGGRVLDLACGGGRHSRFFRERGHPVTAVDRDVTAIAGVADAEIVAADLEDGSPWPLPNRRFAAVVVTNYLFRPLFPAILDALDDDGVLLYETFALGNEAYGRPRNPDHLLKPGELLEVAAGRLQVVAFEQGVSPRPAVVQRLCAIRGSRLSPLPA